MDEPADRQKLTRALARLVACRQQLQDHRRELQGHASAQLDASNHAVKAASESMRDDPNVLVHRYAKTRMVENARLRAIALRAEGEEDDEAGADGAR